MKDNTIKWILIIILILFIVNHFHVIDFNNFFSISSPHSAASEGASFGGGGL